MRTAQEREHLRAREPDSGLVLGEEALFPGCLVTVRLVGVLQAEQTEHGKTFRNDRLLGASETAVNRPAIQTLADLRTEHLDAIESLEPQQHQSRLTSATSRPWRAKRRYRSRR